ncbi:MAG: hypothetical protein AAGE94_24970 [Acidobacteriota bacterium]
MTDTALATLDPMPTRDRDPVASKAADLLAPLVIRDVPYYGPHLFTGRLEPHGQIAFGSAAVGIKVEFTEGNPLEDLESPFYVAAGPAITATVAKGMEGTFPVDIEAVDGTFAFYGLTIEVAEEASVADVFRVGFSVDAARTGVLQVYVKPGKRRVDTHIDNETESVQKLVLDEAGAGSEALTLLPHHAASRIFKPLSLGSILRVTLDNARKPDEDRGSGGVQQADIIVEPPP